MFGEVVWPRILLPSFPSATVLSRSARLASRSASRPSHLPSPSHQPSFRPEWHPPQRVPPSHTQALARPSSGNASCSRSGNISYSFRASRASAADSIDGLNRADNNSDIIRDSSYNAPFVGARLRATTSPLPVIGHWPLWTGLRVPLSACNGGPVSSERN